MRALNHIAVLAATVPAFTTAPLLAADSDIPPRGPVPFEICDANGDGYVDEQEFNRVRAARAQQRSAEGRGMLNMGNAPRFAEIDTDGDGRMSREEHQVHQRKRQQKRYGDGPTPGM
jgi:hypothetical protein